MPITDISDRSIESKNDMASLADERGQSDLLINENRFGKLEVVLVSDKGDLKTLLLPDPSQGKYGFESPLDDDIAKDVYIEAKDNNWWMYGSEKIIIKGKNNEISSQVVISDECLYAIERGSERYILYAEEINDASLVYHNYSINGFADIDIGRSEENDIVYSNKLVSKNHAKLRWDGKNWNIIDMNSLNGVFVNGRKIQNSKLEVGDVIYVVGLRIIFGIGFISVNSEKADVHIVHRKIIPIIPSTVPIKTDIVIGSSDAEVYFNRKPRKRIALGKDTITVEAPPMSINSEKIPMFLRMGGSMVMSGASMLTGNFTSMISSVLFPVLTQKYTEKQKKEYEEKRTIKYTEYLEKKRLEIDQEIEKEQSVLNQNYQELSSVLAYASQEKRLWERRKSDDDFLSLRLGTGNLPMVAALDYPVRGFDMDEDELVEKMYQLAEGEKRISDVPIMTSLADDYICGVVGERALQVLFVKNMLMQLVTLHSYDEVKIILLCNEHDLRVLEFVKYLPHIWDDNKTIRFLATTTNEAYQISEFFKKEVQPDIDNDVDQKRILKRRPYYVLFAMDKRIFDSMEGLKSVLQAEKNYGVSVLAAFEDLPKECSKIFDLKPSGEHSVIFLKDIEKENLVFHMDSHNPLFAMGSMRKISNTKLKLLSQAYALPKMLTFLEMFSVGRIEHLNVLKRWNENNPVASLAAPVGVGTDGSLFTLDLHEKFQGPHGLVAGMTGSGKSEFIITYILSMAVNYHPDEVAFILIDYKGGGLAGAFEDEQRGIHLPHLVGTITNLDGTAIQRSLMSIQSELTRRQRIFNKTKSKTNEGTMDIYTYQKLYRNHQVKEPLPHLFIISDEFAELKKQEPEFMDKLISAARIGRSLGVHLILATQKPSGVVDDQIWSNTKFRVCLKVQDRSDSMDMLKRPEAAELKDTGRFYLQVGYNEFFALGQSAWCGAKYKPQDEVVVQPDDELLIIDHVGQPITRIRRKVDVADSGMKQIVAVVKGLSDLAERENIKPRKLWKEPLKNLIGIDEIVADYPHESDGQIESLIGMVDDPAHQDQFPMYLNLQQCRNLMIVGESGSGKTTMLQTILYYAVTHHSAKDLNCYILDFSSRNLSVFKNLPHCGAFLTDESEDDIMRFLSFVKEMIEERRKLFSEAEVSSFNAYKEIHDIPLILVVIDNVSRFEEFKNRSDIFSMIGDFMKNGVGYGIKVLFTVGQINDCPTQLRREAGNKIALRARDRYVYSDILDCRCRYEPVDTPGRGICVIGEECYEYQTALTVNEANEKERSRIIREKIEQLIREDDSGYAAKTLAVIDDEQTYEEFCRSFTAERIPIGYHMEDMRKVSVPLQQLDHLSLYFGCERTFSVIIKNVFHAISREKGDLIVVKKAADSLIEKDINTLREQFNGVFTMLDCTSNGIELLIEQLTDVISVNKQYRNKYCRDNGLSDWKKPEAIKMWRKELRSVTDPLFVLFESFADLELALTNDLAGTLSAYLTGCRGHNIYFIACFYADDEDKIRKVSYPDGEDNLDNEDEAVTYRRKELRAITENLRSIFNPSKLTLLFGGRFDKQNIASLPMEYGNISNVCSPVNDNKLLMHYHKNCYQLLMPCGQMTGLSQDDDEQDII